MRVTTGVLEAKLAQLRDGSRRIPFRYLPDEPGYLYAVWLDEPGADDLTAVAPEVVPAGIVYAGVCITESVRRHFQHDDISFTLMKIIAALFREAWKLSAANGGDSLNHRPGRQQVLRWMGRHLTATVVPRPRGVEERELLEALDPPFRLKGWGPERTPLRQHIKRQCAIFNAAP